MAPRHSRRAFLGKVVAGSAALAASSFAPGIFSGQLGAGLRPRSALAAGRSITSASLGTLYRYNTGTNHFLHGDTFTNTWGDDGKLYLIIDDTKGWNDSITQGRNFTFNTLPDDPVRNNGQQINSMDAYGTMSQKQTDDDGERRAWKAGGVTSLNGTLYISVAPQVYGYDGNPQRARNGSIIKSTDHGVTWINHLGETNTAPPRTSSGAMFPSTKFANLVFIEHGKDGAAGPSAYKADQYLYAASFNEWNNGDYYTLGRVLRTDDILNKNKWQFYKGPVVVTGIEPLSDSNWSSDIADVTAIYRNNGKVNFAEIRYVPGIQKYIFFNYYYVPMGDSDHTVWDFYQSDTPWGPWSPFFTKDFNGDGFYIPTAPSKWISADGTSLWLIFAGDYNTYDDPWNTTKYTLHVQEMTLTLGSATNLLTNPGFEAGESPWFQWQPATQADAHVRNQTSPHSGSWSMGHTSANAYQQYTAQLVTGLTNGTYRLSGWIKSSGGYNNVILGAKNFGGTEMKNYLPKTAFGWTRYELPNIQVSNGQCEVYVWSDTSASNKSIAFDDLEFVKTS